MEIFNCHFKLLNLVEFCEKISIAFRFRFRLSLIWARSHPSHLFLFLSQFCCSSPPPTVTLLFHSSLTFICDKGVTQSFLMKEAFNHLYKPSFFFSFRTSLVNPFYLFNLILTDRATIFFCFSWQKLKYQTGLQTAGLKNRFSFRVGGVNSVSVSSLLL